MRTFWTKLLPVILLLSTTLGLSGCGYNAFQSLDEEAKASWSEVLNQYQRRADLVPNLVNVVKGYASHEKEVLTDVANARSKVGSMMSGNNFVQKVRIFNSYKLFKLLFNR